MEQFFSDGAINKWTSETSEPKRAGMLTYELPYLVWTGLLMFMLRLESRRQLKAESDTDVFLANLQERSPEGGNKPILPFREHYRFTRNFIRRLAESFRRDLFSALARFLREISAP